MKRKLWIVSGILALIIALLGIGWWLYTRPAFGFLSGAEQVDMTLSEYLEYHGKTGAEPAVTSRDFASTRSYGDLVREADLELSGMGWRKVRPFWITRAKGPVTAVVWSPGKTEDEWWDRHVQIQQNKDRVTISIASPTTNWERLYHFLGFR